MRTRWWLAVGAATLVVAAVASTAGAADPAGSLSPNSKLAAWSGEVTMGGTQAFPFRVALGPGYWTKHPGSIEVAIRWQYDAAITDLGLTVRNAAGQTLASSSGLDSNAEGVFLRSLPDGDYVAEVDAHSPTNVGRPDGMAPVKFNGLVQLEPLRTGRGSKSPLLPNLVTLKPKNFHLASAANLVPLPENPVTPCYPEETIENPNHPTRCLRFDQVIANVGSGPLELRFDVSGVASSDAAERRMIQRVLLGDGTHRDRLADAYQFHAVHAHVHYRGFGQSKLYRYRWGVGRVSGGTPARIGNKVGFCVIDVLLMDRFWGATGNGPRSHTFPTCNVPSDFEGGRPYLVQGVDVGWADVYGWNLADQYIDVTNLADGLYELEQLANPNGSVLEETRADNRASTVICLRSNSVAEVHNAKEAAACPV